MQIIQSKSSFIEKILRDKEGKLVRAKFCIYENGGRIKARLVDVVYLDENNTETLALSGIKTSADYFSKIFDKEFVSPFVTLNTLYSSGSKPRAPTI